MTLKDKLYNKIEFLSDKEYKDFVFTWFGEDAIFDMLKDSIDSVEQKTIKEALVILK